jgi:hypothetical protein
MRVQSAFFKKNSHELINRFELELALELELF